MGLLFARIREVFLVLFVLICLVWIFYTLKNLPRDMETVMRLLKGESTEELWGDLIMTLVYWGGTAAMLYFVISWF